MRSTVLAPFLCRCIRKRRLRIPVPPHPAEAEIIIKTLHDRSLARSALIPIEACWVLDEVLFTDDIKPVPHLERCLLVSAFLDIIGLNNGVYGDPPVHSLIEIIVQSLASCNRRSRGLYEAAAVLRAHSTCGHLAPDQQCALQVPYLVCREASANGGRAVSVWNLPVVAAASFEEALGKRGYSRVRRAWETGQ